MPIFLDFQVAISVALFLFGIVGGGLWISSRNPSWYSERRLAGFVSFSAGLLLTIAWLEFIPHSFAEHSHQSALLVLAGIFFVLVAEMYMVPFLSKFLHSDPHHHHHHEEHQEHHDHHHGLLAPEAACSALACLIVCTFFDGLNLRTAFSISGQTGWLTTAGLFFHILPDGVVASSMAIAGGFSMRGARKMALAVALSLLLGVTLAYTIGASFPAEHVVLPLAAGVMNYVIFIHLIPVARKNKWSVLYFSLGSLAFLALHFLMETPGHLH